jgi:2-hydroxychromene-2-carboxylate isomerase
VFKATGNQSPVLVALKGAWMWTDMARWARRYGVPLNKNPHFIINTLTLMRIAVGLQLRQPDLFPRYVDAMFHAMWVEPCNLGDAAVVAATLQKAGFDPAALATLAADAEVKAKLIDATDQAVKRGVFGAPTMFVGNDMFFGQDRLEFVREALA